MLLVVGRYDTGQLEAQVRGSRYAWDMRLISIDSLINLVNLKENTEDEDTAAKIRSILIPMEYTRLDRLIDVMFTTAKDVESIVESEDPKDVSVDDAKKGTWVFTESALIDERRAKILRKIGELNNTKLVKKSRALYWSTDRLLGVACTISKRYEGKAFEYWYAFHPQWDDFLAKTNRGLFVLGCMDSEFAFAIPHDVLRTRLSDLNTTTKNGRTYWHIQIPLTATGHYYLNCQKSGNHLDLAQYTIAVNDNN